jgi:hypothetical protein
MINCFPHTPTETSYPTINNKVEVKVEKEKLNSSPKKGKKESKNTSFLLLLNDKGEGFYLKKNIF